MTKQNKQFYIFLSFASLLLLGVLAENITYTLRPKRAELVIDVEKVKSEIQKAGLLPREAKYWIETR